MAAVLSHFKNNVGTLQHFQIKLSQINLTTRPPSNLRPTTCECVHLVRRSQSLAVT